MGKKKDRKTDSILLDEFSDADLTKWKKTADDIHEYCVRVYYHLESLRTLNKEKINEALNCSQPIMEHHSVGARIIDYKYSNNPLSSKGSLIRGGRFNTGYELSEIVHPFPCLYIADNEQTAYLEKFGRKKDLKGELSENELSLRKPSSYTCLQVEYNLNNIFDLRYIKNLNPLVDILKGFKLDKDLEKLAKKIGKKPPYTLQKASQLKRMLLDNWTYEPSHHGIPANSHIFGRLVKEAGFEGILYPSTKNNQNSCLAVFIENFEKSDSYIKLADYAPETVKHVTLNKSNWKELSIFES